MAKKLTGASAEFLGQLASANGIQCDPLADSRDEIIAKLDDAGVTLPKD